MKDKIISPCISICKTDPVTGYCYGCARTNEEKKQWKEFVETVLINYYDPKYEFSHAQNINNVIYSYKLNNFSKKNILELVEKIIQKTN